MPGSVRRSDSQRSDSSTDSRKKVSFNRAVKVKKYSRPGKHTQTITEIPEKKFWFKVYKNRHRQEPDLVRETREFDQQNQVPADFDTLHPSQMPAEAPHVPKDHVRQIVDLFDREAVIKTPSEDGRRRMGPADPPTDYGTRDGRRPSPKQKKKNLLVNGVKVMFGANSLRKKAKDEVGRKNALNLEKSRTDKNKSNDQKGPHKTNIVVPDVRATTDRRFASVGNGLSYRQDPAGIRDSDDGLALDSDRVEVFREGTLRRSTEERRGQWKPERPARYRKSFPDTGKKVVHTGSLDYSDEERNEARCSRHSDVVKEDKAIQCDEFWEDSDSWDSETQSDAESYRVIRSKNGFVSAFSHVPSLESYEKNDAIYSLVDKSKKKKNQRPPLATPSDPASDDTRAKEDSYRRHTGENKVKTTKRSFGFKLRNGFREDVYDVPAEKDWYDVDEDLREVERRKKSEKFEREETTPGSVIGEVDYGKREISYENVHRKEGPKNEPSARDGSLWFRRADDDYRRDMASGDEPSYSPGGRTGNDSESGRSRTPDRHRHRNDRAAGNVKILVNGKALEEEEAGPRSVRGGLAASYHARRKAALRGSGGGGSSAASGVSSSDSESGRRRKPVVLYVPGVGHPDRSADRDDRLSGASVARTQSMLSSSRNSGRGSAARYSRHSGSDLSRSNSMPKDVKFPWFKWKIRAKPSREP